MRLRDLALFKSHESESQMGLLSWSPNFDNHMRRVYSKFKARYPGSSKGTLWREFEKLSFVSNNVSYLLSELKNPDTLTAYCVSSFSRSSAASGKHISEVE